MKGTHNTLTAYAPLRWWGWLAIPFWRCQTKDITAQIAAGVRAFDLRFVWRAPGWGSAHGAVDLAADPLAALDEIERLCPGACVRVILEKGDAGALLRFMELCRALPCQYPDLVFFEGIYKPQWRRLYDFGPQAKAIEATEQQHYGSHHAWWKGAVPRLWWWLHRHDAPAAANTPTHPIVFEDFV